MFKSVIVYFTALVSLTFGHLCLLSPPQRGTANNINSGAAADCALTTAPCGGRILDTVSGSAFVAGRNVTVTLQKNINHFNSGNPGYFTISIGADETSFKELRRIPDTVDPSHFLYSASITVPQTTGRMVLQVSYVTNNTPAYYQCSDVLVVADTVVVG